MMWINTVDGIKMSKDIARWHAKEVLKAEIDECLLAKSWWANDYGDLFIKRISSLQSELKSLEVEK